MPVPFWAGHYIGLPFEDHGRNRAGLDCWGLVRLVLQEQRGIALPSFATEYRRTTDTQKISDLILRETPAWAMIAGGEEALGDIIILRQRGAPMHVGFVLGDKHMLHIEHGINSAIEDYSTVRWRDRIFGFFRYRKEVGDGAGAGGAMPRDPKP
jgi:cell wall-associated NlpC family hydrolase